MGGGALSTGSTISGENHVIYCFGTVSKFLNFLTSNLVVSALENACLAVYVSINVYLLSLSNKCP